jgi:predicted acylesterase/phospholipase RssA
VTVRRRGAAALVLLAFAGCAHWRVNDRLPERPASPGYRFEALPADAANTDSLMVCLAFSGGGTRAAALAFGVLEELRDTTVVWDGKERRLLDEVDAISAVSGGAFVGASWALFRDRAFDHLHASFLDRDVESDLKFHTALASFWLPFSPLYTRGDLAADYFDSTIFGGKTYGDLAAAGRPYLMVNATDLSTGEPFAFTQDQFDLIGSDLASYRVANSVTASCSVPVVFPPITIANWNEPDRAVPPELAREEADGDARLARWAEGRARYVAAGHPKFHHLADGGIADNSGVRALWAELRRPDGFLARAIRDRPVRKLLVIAVDASSEWRPNVGDEEHHPNVLLVARMAAPIAVNGLTFENLRLLRDDPAIKAALAQRNVDFRFVEVGLRAIADPERRKTLGAIPTTLGLPREQVAQLITAGREVLRNDPEMKRFLADLGGKK